MTLAVQFGFVAGTLGSAVFNLPDVFAPRRLVVVASLLGAAANASLALFVHGPAGRARPALRDGRLPRGRLPAGDEDPRDVVPGAARPRARLPRRRAHARQGVPVPRERRLRLRVADERPRRLGPRGARRAPRRLLGPRGAVRAARRALRRHAGREGPEEPRRAPRDVRLLRPHVGALRDVDVDSRHAPLEPRAARRVAGHGRGRVLPRDRLRRRRLRRRRPRGRPRGPDARDVRRDGDQRRVLRRDRVLLRRPAGRPSRRRGRLGRLRRRGLGAVLGGRDGARRSRLHGDGAHAPDLARLPPDGRLDRPRAGVPARPLVALGLRPPRARPGARRRRDAAPEGAARRP